MSTSCFQLQVKFCQLAIRWLSALEQFQGTEGNEIQTSRTYLLFLFLIFFANSKKYIFIFNFF